jgi:hypothetical protein
MVMVRRSPTQWRALFREQEASGLKASAFCRSRGLCPNYFSLRRRQLSAGLESDTRPATASAFAPVTVRRPTESVVEIRLGTTLSLNVPVTVSPAWLAQVLHGLRD